MSDTSCFDGPQATRAEEQLEDLRKSILNVVFDEAKNHVIFKRVYVVEVVVSRQLPT